MQLKSDLTVFAFTIRFIVSIISLMFAMGFGLFAFIEMDIVKALLAIFFLIISITSSPWRKRDTIIDIAVDFTLNLAIELTTLIPRAIGKLLS